jgi:hypothetical protein
MTEYKTIINGIEVKAFYSDKAVNEIFIPLLKKLTTLQNELNRRILVMLAAPPGTGKSTLAGFLEKLSAEVERISRVQAIGMDGFHRRQEYLVSHNTYRDGNEIPMVDIKGAPVTFDIDKLTESIRRITLGENFGWPGYDRLLHNPVEDAVFIEGDIILLEGNYLLLDDDGWRELSKYADYTISLKASEDMLHSRLLDRKIKSGASAEKAAAFVDFSDMFNVRICLEKTMKADLELIVDDDGEIVCER